jgi:hypothetical protein
VCSRLRTVLNAAPELWADVGCSWPDGLIQHHLARAGPRILTMKADIGLYWSQYAERVTPSAFQRVESLTIRLSHRPTQVMQLLGVIETRSLQSIAVLNSGEHLDLHGSTFRSSINSNLSVLHLKCMHIVSFPALPALRRLSFVNVCCQVAGLYGFLLCAT